jgi:hypothetical protein
MAAVIARRWMLFGHPRMFALVAETCIRETPGTGVR